MFEGVLNQVLKHGSHAPWTRMDDGEIAGLHQGRTIVILGWAGQVVLDVLNNAVQIHLSF